MIEEIVIGKHTLESLTTGMYSDAKVIYREYIQNSVDSIEEAIAKGIIDRKEAKINITVNKGSQKIIISDNGTRISSEEAMKKLLDIGNSTKDPEDAIGFRGIGRLAGLSYCKNLKFITSYQGERKKTTVSFDASKLEKLLIPKQYSEYDLLRVIEEITTTEVKREELDKHYFKVILEGVENTDYILEYDRVKRYLSQVAPLPFDPNKFSFAQKIKNKLKSENIFINEYNIFLNDSDSKDIQLFKPISSKFVADIRNKTEDYIKDVEVKSIKDKKGDLIAVLWYTKSNFYGTIVDNKKKGLRLRKRNIQIGDRSTLNCIFKEDRFNGWFQGEVYAIDKNLVPNARRDNFEKNQTYKTLLKKLQRIGDELSKEIRKISKQRNKVKKKKKLYKKFDYLNDTVNDAHEFKILNLIDSLSENEKEVLDKVFNIISDNYEKEKVDEFINEIIDNF
jgi:molecular chaperone HtpG